MRVSNDSTLDLTFKFNRKFDPGPLLIVFVVRLQLPSVHYLIVLHRLRMSVSHFFCALVRPIFENYTVVSLFGIPTLLVTLVSFEEYNGCLCGFPVNVRGGDAHDCAPVANVLNLSFLAERCRSAGISFFNGLLYVGGRPV